MPRASDFRKLGREALAGNWGLAALVTFIAIMLMGGLYYMIMPFIGYNLMYLSAAAIALINIYLLGVLVVTGALTLGLYLFFINLQHRDKAGVKTLFSRFHIFGKALLLTLFMGVFILLWSLLLIVPGIIAAYRYYMAYYLMTQNPDLGVSEAVDLSKKMMTGHKGRLFCLHFSFIGWALLAAVPSMIGSWFGGLLFITAVLSFIGGLIVQVYMYSAQTAFFLDLQYHYQQEVINQASGATALDAASKEPSATDAALDSVEDSIEVPTQTVVADEAKSTEADDN